MRSALLTCLLIACLTGCSWSPTISSQPADAGSVLSSSGTSSAHGYLLAGSNSGRGFSENALLLFDTATLEPRREVSLPASRARYLRRDPEGRLWIGLSGTMDRGDDRLLIFSAGGEREAVLHPCGDPEGGVTFAAGRAFVACAEDGFAGRVVALDRETLEPVGELVLQLPNAPFILLGSGATGGAVAVSGLTSGPDPNLTYTAIAVIDPEAVTLEQIVPLGPATDVWAVLPYGERFVLLNAASAHAPEPGARRDVLLFDPQAPEAMESLALPAPSPLWGVVADDTLYAYHNPAWNTIHTSPDRTLSRTNLITGESESWPLPDAFEAGDLALVGGRLCLAHWDYRSADESHGLYCLTEAGDLEQVLTFTDASQIVVPGTMDFDF